MSTMIQIRNVPDEIHRQVKSRAALTGMSMSEYILRDLQRSLERPTRAEILQRIAELAPIELDPSAAEILREERDDR